MSSIQPPWTMARHKLMSNHADDTTAWTESEGQTSNASASEVAERFVDLSAFVYKGYCTGILMIDLPIFKTMKHLSNRLYSYAFSLVVEKSVNFLTRPGQSTTLSTTTAAESMGQLAAFLQRKADDLDTCGLSSGTEVSLAIDLRFAEEYTTSLLESKVQGNGIAHSLPIRQDHPASQTPIVEAPRPVSENAGQKAKVAQTPSEQSSARPAPICPPEVGEVRNGEHTKLLQTLLHTNSVPHCTNYRFGEPASVNFGLETPSQALSTSASGSTTPVERSPHVLPSTPFNTHHAPILLSGPRLRSHIGLDDYDAFIEHCFISTKILGSNADPCTMAQIGHSTTELFQPHQLIDIAVLGFEGIKAVKLVHPLCPREVASLSFDVLRYIDYVLSELDAVRRLTWTKDASEKSVLARQAEKQSLSMVEKELAARKREPHCERPTENKAATQAGQAVTRERDIACACVLNNGTAVQSFEQMSDTKAASSEGVPEHSLSGCFARDTTNQASSPRQSIDDEGPSVEQLRAQLAALGTESTGPASLNVDVTPFLHMPNSALQGPRSDIQGPHEEFCECRVQLDRSNKILRAPQHSTDLSSKAPQSTTLVEGEKHVSFADPPPLIVYTEAQTCERYADDDAGRQPRSIGEPHGLPSASTSVPPPRLRSSRGRKRIGDEDDDRLSVEKLLENGCSTNSREKFEAEVLDRFLARNA